MRLQGILFKKKKKKALLQGAFFYGICQPKREKRNFITRYNGTTQTAVPKPYLRASSQ